MSVDTKLHMKRLIEQLMQMNKDEKKKFLRDVDLTKTRFELKIADFGFSKKLKDKS